MLFIFEMVIMRWIAVIKRKFENRYLEKCENESREYPDQGLVTEGVDSDDVEMAKKPDVDGVSAPTWRTHGADELSVLENDLGCVFQVVPVAVVEVVAQQFDGRLRAVPLSRRHVHIVDEDYRLLADRWTKEAFATFVHFGHYQSLKVDQQAHTI